MDLSFLIILRSDDLNDENDFMIKSRHLSDS